MRIRRPSLVLSHLRRPMRSAASAAAVLLATVAFAFALMGTIPTTEALRLRRLSTTKAKPSLASGTSAPSSGAMPSATDTARATAAATSLSTPSCKLSEWSPWSVCTEGCGGGKHVRTRKVLRPGQDCPRPGSNQVRHVEECHVEPRCGRDLTCTGPGAFVFILDFAAHSMGLPNAIVDRLTPGKSAVALIDACNGKNPVTTLKMTTDLKTVKTNIDAHEHCLLDVTDGPKAHDAVNMAVRILLGAGGTETKPLPKTIVHFSTGRVADAELFEAATGTAKEQKIRVVNVQIGADGTTAPSDLLIKTATHFSWDVSPTFVKYNHNAMERSPEKVDATDIMTKLCREMALRGVAQGRRAKLRLKKLIASERQHKLGERNWKYRAEAKLKKQWREAGDKKEREMKEEKIAQEKEQKRLEREGKREASRKAKRKRTERHNKHTTPSPQEKLQRLRENLAKEQTKLAIKNAQEQQRLIGATTESKVAKIQEALAEHRKQTRAKRVEEQVASKKTVTMGPKHGAPDAGLQLTHPEGVVEKALRD